jgi:hypothetical protein
MFKFRHCLTAGALSLSLVSMAGCASPIAVPTAATADAVAQAPAAGPTAAPDAPETTAPSAAARSFQGTATFRGEPLAGYALQVLDAHTGEPVPVVASLDGATGLAVLQQSMLTDAEGRFTVQVAGLVAGKALRVVATHGNARLETLVTGNGTLSTAAAQRRVLGGADTLTLTLNEITTALAGIARGVVVTTRVLTPEAAAPVLGALLARLALLNDSLSKSLESQPHLANQVVADEDGTAIKLLVTQAGALQALTRDVADLVAEVAKATKDDAKQAPAAKDPAVQAALAKVTFLGTVLAATFDGSSRNFTLSNAVTGASADAASGDMPGLTAKVTRSSSHSTSPSISLAPIAAPDPIDEDTALTVSGLEATLTKLEGPATLTVSDDVGGTGAVTDGVLTWTPPQNYNGTATLTVRAAAGSVAAEQTLSVEVTPVNDRPELIFTPFGSGVIAAGTNLTIHAFDPDGDAVTLTITAPPTTGSAEIMDDGSIFFLPLQGEGGIDAFTYTVSDGHGVDTYTQDILVSGEAEL